MQEQYNDIVGFTTTTPHDYHNYKTGHPTDAGLDIPFDEEIHIKPGETKIVELPLDNLNLPYGVIAIPFVRSKYAKEGIICAPTIIDPHYTGTVHVWLSNTSYEPKVIAKGTEFIQIVKLQVEHWQFVESKTNERRGKERDTTR